MGYAIIGDVHGAAAKLEWLLLALGYKETGSSYSHPNRKAIFVGDLIDRGSEQLRTLSIVRSMLKANTAEMVMGNHELNAITFATANVHRPGHYLRKHSLSHINAHQAFLDEVKFGSSMHLEIIDWFKSLPLWLEFDSCRIVHAC